MLVESLPILFDDGIATATGFEDIVAYLRNHPTAANHDLDAKLSSRQQTDRTAFVTFFQSIATPLIDLSLYVSAENYHSATAAAYTQILPWYANYTIPPRRREVARARTAHMGLAGLDVDNTAEEVFTPGRGTASSQYEAAKRAAGIPTDGLPNQVNTSRRGGLGGLLGRPTHAARCRLDALLGELLDPWSDLLGDHNYIFRASAPSSLDLLAFGYLSLLLYPDLPQAWIKETMQTKYPRIASYVHRVRQHVFQNEVIEPSKVWLISAGAEEVVKSSTLLPWQPRRQNMASSAAACVREILGNTPGLSLVFQSHPITASELPVGSRHQKSALLSSLAVNTMLGATATLTVVLAYLAVHHRRSPRDGILIFWALRPSVGLGEAGNILSVLAHQMPSGASLSPH